MSCYDAVQGKGYLWTSGWFRGGSVSVWASPPRSLLPPCVFEGRRSLCYLLTVNWLETEKFGGGKKRFVGTDHKHIPDYSLSVLSFESRLFLGETIQHVSSSC